MFENTARLYAALANRYEIERRLGEGGMATVYLAEDLKHKRKVAVKVLRPELAAVLGADRFVQEITTTASLQHPHILPLFDSGEADGFLYYVMPFIDGETLREKLDRETQLGVDESIQITTAIADALDYAHRQTVIHRDIKPENILLHDGRPMVADFGIALAVSAAAGGRMTETGLSLGTPHYMSPEQATAEKNLTSRSDIYSLGSVLYEMLTGDPPHTGSSAQQIIMKIVTDTPRPVTELRKSVPPHVAAATAKALEKLAADRFESAAKFAEALTNPAFAPPVTQAATPRGVGTPRASRAWRSTAFMALLLLLVSWIYLWPGERNAGERILRASLLPPSGCRYTPVRASNLLQLSPVGRKLAYIATCDGVQSLWLRSLETSGERSLPGTGGASYPFWSPDGLSLGFFSDARLKRIDIGSGAVRDLAAAPFGRRGTWNEDGQILFAPDIRGSLYLVSAEGGEALQETFVQGGSTGESHRVPEFMPDGRHYIYSIPLDSQDEGIATKMMFGELGATEPRQLMDIASNVMVRGEYLLYVNEGALVARRFSPETGELQGNAKSLVSGLETWEGRALGNYSVSGDGSLLIYRELTEQYNKLAWLNPTDGALSPLDQRGVRQVDVSPDGRMLLSARYTGPGQRYDVWSSNIASGQETRLCSTGGSGWCEMSPCAPTLPYSTQVKVMSASAERRCAGSWSTDSHRITTGASSSSSRAPSSTAEMRSFMAARASSPSESPGTWKRRAAIRRPQPRVAPSSRPTPIRSGWM
jgi:eukaryotic-like serine/threonine-protein kinase